MLRGVGAREFDGRVVGQTSLLPLRDAAICVQRNLCELLRESRMRRLVRGERRFEKSDNKVQEQGPESTLALAKRIWASELSQGRGALLCESEQWRLQ